MKFFQPPTHLKTCQKGPYHSGIKVLVFPWKLGVCLQMKNSLVVLKKFLLVQSSCTLEEYFNYKHGNTSA
jgi:hypothetical protein